MYLRVMTKADVPAGLRLNELAGWNQTADDWQRFLEASPSGCFVAEEQGEVRGTATTISYENRFAWIGMVLVDPEYRKQGIGTQLLQRTIEYLDERRIPTVKLDATPLGQPLYRKLGFVTEYEIERWILKRRNAITNRRNASKLTLTEIQLEPVLRFDYEIFGANRSPLLNSLRDMSPDLAMGVWNDGAPQGYSFGRRGLFADHLGPWVAKSRAAAAQLLQEFLENSSRETLIVDCLTANVMATELLRSYSFAPARYLTRMFRGPNADPGNREFQCAIVGPEFG
ncbi:MAG: GNAT family N-acetyltransferase [Candidatus Acidiferrum sp.]